MMGFSAEWLYDASTWVLPVLLAITLHEAAHGFMAWRLGDGTARAAGRLSLNPVRHIDPFGTIILPAMLLLFKAPFLFGWAKPVPVQFGNLRHPKRDMVWVALAGPGTNLLLAIAGGLAVHLAVLVPMPEVRGWLIDNLGNLILINIVLAVFNMIPLPPLDGGRVAVGLLPMPLALRLSRLEKKGMLILIGLIFILPFIGNQIGIDLNVLSWILGTPVQFLAQTVLQITGH